MTPEHISSRIRIKESLDQFLINLTCHTNPLLIHASPLEENLWKRGCRLLSQKKEILSLRIPDRVLAEAKQGLGSAGLRNQQARK